MLNAIKDGVTVFNATTMNPILAQQDFKLIYEGTLIDSKTGAGTTEQGISTYYRCSRFTLTGVTSISRIEMDLSKDGVGADLTVQIRDGMDPVTGVEGTVLKEIVIPKEFIPAAAVYWSMPINLSGLTAGAYYHIVTIKAGDSTDNLDWVSEGSADPSYPSYSRSGTSGAWITSGAAHHFKVYSGNSGDLVHGIFGTNLVETYVYSGEDMDKVYRYLPPSDGADGGIRDIIDLTFDGDYLTDGTVT